MSTCLQVQVIELYSFWANNAPFELAKEIIEVTPYQPLFVLLIDISDRLVQKTKSVIIGLNVAKPKTTSSIKATPWGFQHVI